MSYSGAQLKKANQGEDAALERANKLEKAKEAAEAQARRAEVELGDLRANGAPDGSSTTPTASAATCTSTRSCTAAWWSTTRRSSTTYSTSRPRVRPSRSPTTSWAATTCGPTTKTFTAVYAFGGKGPFRYISQREGQVVKFE